MKLSYSTLACPEWSWSVALDAAKALGYDGIEWRIVDGEFITPEFSLATARTIGNRAQEQGTDVCAVDTGISLACPPSPERDRLIDDLIRLIRIAAEMSAPRLRVFSGVYPESVSDEEAVTWVREVLAAVVPDARVAGIQVVMEIHPDFPWDRPGTRGTTSSAFAARVLDGADLPEAGIQWDIGNPYYEGEAAEQTWRNVRPHLCYLHTKDMRRCSDGTWRYVLMGEGVLPVDEILGWLRDDGYTGWLSFEWEKRWVPELAPPEVALPHYVDFMRRRFSALGITRDSR